jgi:putative hemolysin
MASWLIIIFLLGASAFFAASEMAIMWVPMYKIQRFHRQFPKNKAIQYLLILRSKTERALITILICNNLVNVLFSIYADNMSSGFLKYFAISWFLGSMIVVSSITLLLLLFGEIMPKAFASRFALQLAMFVSPFISFVQRLLIWIVRPLEQLVKWVNSLFNEWESGVSRDDVEIFVEEWEKQGIFTLVESMIVKNLMVFRETSVEAVFKHRTEIFALADNITLEESIKIILKNPYSRIPIYHTDKDHIIWLITLRDLVWMMHDTNNHTKQLREFPLKSIAKVPITASIFHMFTQMKEHGRHMAIVVDEYGWTAWLVTLEDILEMMVGDIKDESDHYEEQDIFHISATKVIAKWDVILRDILHHFKINHLELPEDLEDEIDEESMLSTIILERLKEFAQQWDKVNLWHVELEVYSISWSGERIEKVRVQYLGDKKTTQPIKEENTVNIETIPDNVEPLIEAKKKNNKSM